MDWTQIAVALIGLLAGGGLTRKPQSSATQFFDILERLNFDYLCGG